MDGRPAELLKVLIALGGRDVSVSRIGDLMWPRIDADYAQRSFNTTLHRLRKILGDDRLLILHGGRLSLNADVCWLDLWVFEQHVSELITLLRETNAWIDLPRASWLANQVLELYQGAFFDQDDSSWVVVPRDQWKQKFVRAIGDMAIRLKEANQPEQAIDVLERGLETDSLVERFYQQLMACYVQTGRKVQAAEVYRRAVAMFQSQFQMAPSEELQRSYQLLVAD